MKTKRLIKAVVAAAALAWAGDASGIGVGVTPYTFCGRLTDAALMGFDGDRTATVSAYGGGKLLATGTTFCRADSRRNYAINVPMATAAAEGYAVQNDQLTLTVTDDADGKEWSGVVPPAESVVREPGGVKEMDIVLCAPGADTKGVDYDLYWTLYVDWMYSKYYKDGEEFDPHADHDGDGMTTLDEARAGTDPYDPESRLSITGFEHAGEAGAAVEFSASPGRAYSVEGATSLAAGDWQKVEFAAEEGAGVQKVIACPLTVRDRPMRVFLKPRAGARFFRVRQE